MTVPPRANASTSVAALVVVSCRKCPVLVCGGAVGKWVILGAPGFLVASAVPVDR